MVLNFKKDWVQVFLVAKVLLWKNWKVMDWLLYMQVVMLIEKELRAGELLKVDTGCVVAYTAGVDFDIEFIRGIKNWMFGGEGLFFAILQGPVKYGYNHYPSAGLPAELSNMQTFFISRCAHGSTTPG